MIYCLCYFHVFKLRSITTMLFMCFLSKISKKKM